VKDYHVIKRTLCLAGIVGLSATLFRNEILALGRMAWSHEEYSYIFAIPLICVGLLVLEQKRIFGYVETNITAAIIALLIAVVWRLGLVDSLLVSESGRLFASILGLAAIWVSGFVCCYGVLALRAGLFPILFLFLMVPVPAFAMNAVISWLQKGSAEAAYMLFSLLDVPILRNGLVFLVPGYEIHITEECSGIRSALGLMITSLIAGHLLLRSVWAKLVLAAATIPLLIIKNAIRIVGISLLSIYVDPTVFVGSLHRQGGAVFFALALALLAPVLWWLQRTEALQRRSGSTAVRGTS
jgi:exosortase